MEATVQTLSSTFMRNFDYFCIPPYQRKYTWDIEQYETLWEDLIDNYAEFKKSKKKDQFFLFLGSVVFVQNSRVIDIIDGQQRITTLTILFRIILQYINDENEEKYIQAMLNNPQSKAKLKVASRDSSDYLAILNNTVTDSKSNLNKCALYFKEKIEGIINDKRINISKFSEFIREHTQLIVIIADNYTHAWDLFIGLNGKGVPLRPADLIKAHVCGVKNIIDEDQIDSIWDSHINVLKNDSTSFFLAFTRYKEQSFFSENNLFEHFSKSYSRLFTFDDIIQKSELYRKIWINNLNDKESPFKGDAKKALHLLRLIDRRDITILIFKYYDAFGEKSTFDKTLIKLLAAFQIRMAVSRKRSLESKITQFCKENDFTKIDITSAIALILLFIKDQIISDADFKTAVQKLTYSDRPTRAILQLREEGMYQDVTHNSFNLEHLMPDTSTKFWEKVSGKKGDDYKRLVNNIGNLFILDEKTNKKIQNKEFKIKKEFYRKYADKLEIGQIAKLTTWDAISIEKRAIAIAKWVCKQWPMDI
jgi:hypothetical protein